MMKYLENVPPANIFPILFIALVCLSPARLSALPAFTPFRDIQKKLVLRYVDRIRKDFGSFSREKFIRRLSDPTVIKPVLVNRNELLELVIAGSETNRFVGYKAARPQVWSVDFDGIEIQFTFRKRDDSTHESPTFRMECELPDDYSAPDWLIRGLVDSYTRLAKKGVRPARLMLGAAAHVLISGRLCKADPALGFECLETASELGLASARLRLAACLLHGVGCRRDRKRAIRLLQGLISEFPRNRIALFLAELFKLPVSTKATRKNRELFYDRSLEGKFHRAAVSMACRELLQQMKDEADRKSILSSCDTESYFPLYLLGLHLKKSKDAQTERVYNVFVDLSTNTVGNGDDFYNLLTNHLLSFPPEAAKRFARCVTAARVGNFRGAEANYVEAARLGWPAAQRAFTRFLFDLGRAQMKEKSPGLALRTFEQAQIRGYSGPSMVYRKVECYCALKKWDKAVATLQKASLDFPGEVPVFENLAILYQAAGRKKLAEKAWLKVLELDPSHPRAKKHLGAR